MFLGGTNVAHDVLKAYDPLVTGRGRLFMVRQPVWLASYVSGEGNGNKFKFFKHMLEYANTSIQGLSDITVNFQTITGGYSGKSFEIPTHATDDMSTFTVTCYEPSGSPLREMIHTWINGSMDLMSTFTHYNGELDKVGGPSQANQTAEFIYVNLDKTGRKVEYACFLANCFPRQINTDQFNYTSGTHDLVETGIEFSCTKYESTQINAVANELINRYKVLTNSLNFNSGINFKTNDSEGLVTTQTGNIQNFSKYDYATGKLTSSDKTTNDKDHDKPVNVSSVVAGDQNFKYSSLMNTNKYYVPGSGE